MGFSAILTSVNITRTNSKLVLCCLYLCSFGVLWLQWTLSYLLWPNLKIEIEETELTAKIITVEVVDILTIFIFLRLWKKWIIVQKHKKSKPIDIEHLLYVATMCHLICLYFTLITSFHSHRNSLIYEETKV